MLTHLLLLLLDTNLEIYYKLNVQYMYVNISNFNIFKQDFSINLVLNGMNQHKFYDDFDESQGRNKEWARERAHPPPKTLGLKPLKRHRHQEPA